MQDQPQNTSPQPSNSSAVKHLTVSGPTHRMVGAESARLGVTRTEYADAAIRYFAERGLNPVESQAREGQLIMAEVKRLGDRVFSYLQEQERGLLLEMLRFQLRQQAVQEQTLRVVENLLAPEGGESLHKIQQKNQARIAEAVAAGVAALDIKALKKTR
ncbi:hypothetical protein J0X19_20970 [Hymenobacter sp. BT186]|uniref:Uncharacterized protein n=1 Tax=Hymenobacter telluris TaxID=2816474 RepID=A0A939JFI3_9BACT|nr:hypothetical protein [Hymenobacter telluris]MBO0360447.1 hypothetical protein [Hymenobacter telluris]MBW3376474.1 hypothetical protein [Hymenobacter norwichensis]